MVNAMPVSARGARRIDPRLVHEQQRRACHRDARADQQLPPHTLPQEEPRESGIGDQQHREDDRDEARGDERLRPVDEVEVEDELEQPDPGREQPAGGAEAETLPPGQRERPHGEPADQEAIADRPGGRDDRDLVADDQPGRPPDQRDDREGDEDRGAGRAWAGVELAHSAAIASARRATSWPSLSQAVTSRISPSAQS
jgi:hypothetical protein